MKKSHLKFNVRRLTTCTAIVLAGMLASCSNDDVENKEPEQPVVSAGNTETLKLISGASQAGRVERVAETKTFMKWERLAYVGTITPVKEKEENEWSATAVAFNADGTKAYVTWHSNKQAKENPAKVWGGAVDVVETSSLDLEVTALSDTLKFNHVLYDAGYLFLASTSATNAGTVGRIELSNDGFGNEASVDMIGFPGVSVNAVAKSGDNLVAVSGYAGTYATFAPDIYPQPYYYGNVEGKNLIEATVDNEFGGKYVTTDGDDVYVLHNTKSATITKINGRTWDLGVGLVSSKRATESYDPDTKEWIVSNVEHDYYGKHVFAVKGGIAYVACGKNGLVVYDLNAEKVLYTEKGLNTIGVCADGDYVYAATEVGLRVYNWNNGVFDVCAYEVKEYKDGIPTSKDTPTTGTDERHSPNFVAVNPTSKEIYVAYGQSGVRVYKFRPEIPAEEVTE